MVGVMLTASCSADLPDSAGFPGERDAVARAPVTPAATADPGPLLPEQWTTDTNDNGIPDFIEEAEGWDLDQVRCLADLDCGGGTDELLLQQASVLLVLDASGSMAQEVADGQKMNVAKDALEFYATGVPDTVDLGFMVYGHKGSADPARKQESCEGVELLAPLGEADRDSLPGLLAEFQPAGFTPIAGALVQARQAFAGREDGNNRVILVSDGLETCDGDPVAAAAALREAGVAKLDVVAFDAPEDEAASLAAIAEAGGGSFVTAADGGALRSALRDDLQAFYGLLASQACVVSGSVTAKGCLAAQQTRVTLRFDELLQEGPGDGQVWTDPQREEILEILKQAEQRNLRQQRLLEGEGVARITELNRALQDARRRIEETYGETIEVGWGPQPACLSRTQLVGGSIGGGDPA